MPAFYLANTALQLDFLNPRRQRHSPDWKNHGDFILKLREQCPDAQLPYLALFAHGNGFVPDCNEASRNPYVVYASGGLVVPISEAGEVMVADDRRIGLDEFISRCVEGISFPFLGTTPRIGGIVELSPTELYPDAMARLGQRYDIRRVMVE